MSSTHSGSEISSPASAGQKSTGAQLAVALDLEPRAARELGAKLASEVGYLKIGLSLFCSEGPPIVRELKAAGARIFLDLKLHDIPNTVSLAAKAVGELGVDLMTTHASGGPAMIRACVEGAQQGALAAKVKPPTVLAVTVLTSLDAETLAKVGFAKSPAQTVEQLAKMAIEAGAGGIVCSPKEAALVRSAIGDGPLIVTPGIRPAGEALGDQARTETPQGAIESGANVLVVGRPILQAADPVAAARQMGFSVGQVKRG